MRTGDGYSGDAQECIKAGHSAKPQCMQEGEVFHGYLQHPAWRVEFLTFIVHLLREDIKAFPTTYFLPSRYGRLRCARCPPFFFSGRCLRQHPFSLLLCQQGHHLLFRNDGQRPSPKVLPTCKIPTLRLEISPKQQ